MENIFVEFLPPWVETGLQPAFYDKESGTALQQTARMYSRVNMLIRMFNRLSNNTKTVVEDYIDQFNELHDYVHDYFDNLDVQEQINNKLDAMAEDGSLTALISAYVDPIFNEFTEGINETVNDINETVDNQNSKINTIENKVLSATSGAPQGSYPTYADLVAANPSHSYIYVVVADGNWYYYNQSTSTWTEGGVYQSNEGVISYGFTDNLLDVSTVDYQKLMNQSNVLSTNEDYNVSDYIAVTPGETYTFLMPVRSFLEFDSDRTPGTWHYANDTTNNFYEAPYEFTVPAGTYFIRLNFFYYSIEPMVVAGTTTTKNYIQYAKKEVNNIDFSDTNYESLTNAVIDNLYPIPSTNLINPDKYSEGTYIYTNKGALRELASYNTTDFIGIEPETSYYINVRYRFALYYDEYCNPIPSTYVSAWTDGGVFTTPEDAYYVRFTVSSSEDEVMLIKSLQAVDYIPYQRQLPPNVGLTDKMREEIQGVTVLTGKKLVACGDSFTQYTNAQFTSGIYAGQNKTYPYLIGLRNNMTVENIAVSGSTIAVNSGDQVKFSDTLYTTIPADADYILIKYGINDSHQNIPIGTINDNVNTTFYGAWNIVLSYIIEHHPLAKIGIIVSNGLDYNASAPDGSYYARATKEIAVKYGIPTLNEWDDPNVPLLNRTGRTDVNEDIRTRRNETFRVSPTNTHENWQAQEYESTFVEDFLKKL